MPLRHLLSFDEFRARYGFKPAEYRQYVVDSNALELEKSYSDSWHASRCRCDNALIKRYVS